MKFTAKSTCFLTILLISLKSGQPSAAFFSVYGDKNFLFHDNDVANGAVVGFVYQNDDYGFTVSSCDGFVYPYWITMKDDCTVVANDAIAVDYQLKTSIDGRGGSVPNIPVPGSFTNVMIGRAGDPFNLIIKNNEVTKDGNVTAFALENVVGANPAESWFYCNDLSQTDSGKLFTVDAAIGNQIKYKQDYSADLYPAITKCFAYIKVYLKSKYLLTGTFMVVITDHAQKLRFSQHSMTNLVLTKPAVYVDTAVGTTVGYIDGSRLCPSSSELAFEGSESSDIDCKGRFYIAKKMLKYIDNVLSFSYYDRNYNLLVNGSDNRIALGHLRVFMGIVLSLLLKVQRYI